jgi:hypothetical protein
MAYIYAVRWPADASKSVLFVAAQTKRELFSVIDEIGDPYAVEYKPMRSFAIDVNEADFEALQLLQVSEDAADVVLDRNSSEGWKELPWNRQDSYLETED